MTLVIVVSTVAYGYMRRAQARFESGPRVALVQGNFPSSLKHNPEAWPAMGRTHWELTGLAIKERPDVIVWPETMWTSPLMELSDGLTPEKLETKAIVTLDKLEAGWAVTHIHLDVKGRVPKADQAAWDKATQAAKTGCPISKLLNTTIEMNAKLEG